MSNVVSMNCSCDYLVKRISRHRRSGRFDEAMALLWKARNQFGWTDPLLMEAALIYEEIGCEEEEIKACLRLVRLGHRHKAQALFRLTLISASHGDFDRAVSYYDRLQNDVSNRDDEQNEISSEMISALGKQLKSESRHTGILSARKRAKALERRSAVLLQSGKASAAQRAIEHSLRLHETARGYTMLSCCQLIRERFSEAVLSAQRAHALSPGNVQTLCVLADAFMASQDMKQAKKAIRLAALRAHQVDDLLSVAVESAKAGENGLTLCLTGRILKIAPFHTRAMMIRACALINCKEYIPAKRLLGRLCGLLPEDSVCESYYRALCAGETQFEALTLGLDVTREEGINRASELYAAFYDEQLSGDSARLVRICRLCDWAFHSPMAGAPTKMLALVLLSSLDDEQVKSVLLDLLMDPALSDGLKLNALQLLTARYGFYPYDVDMDGKLVRLAAGGVSEKPIGTERAKSKIVQRVADVLIQKDQRAPGILLDAFLAYLNDYGHPDSRHESACAAALECWYYAGLNKNVDEARIADRYGVSVRLMRIYLHRFESCMRKKEQPQQGE